MTKVDQAFETAAEKLDAFVRDARRQGGVKAKVGDALAEDPEFLRKLKPSLIKARAKGEAPPEPVPGPRPEPERDREPEPPRPAAPKRSRGGPNPWAIVGVALVAGYVLAKFVDWRGHAHPRI
jgi:hypothetical protein